MELSQRCKRHGKVGVAVQHKKSLPLHKRQGLNQGTPGAERLLLDRISDRAVSILLAEMLANGLVHITDREHCTLDALLDPVVEEALKEWSPLHGRHGFWDITHGSAQPRAQAAGEDDCFHCYKPFGW